jgi:hypothetical protein
MRAPVLRPDAPCGCVGAERSDSPTAPAGPCEGRPAGAGAPRAVGGRRLAVGPVSADVDACAVLPSCISGAAIASIWEMTIPNRSERIEARSSPTCTVAVGRYVLELGSPPGTSISLPAQPREADSRSLARALKRGAAGKQKKADVGPLGDALGDASELTAKAERAVALFNGLAQGKVFDPKQLSGEIDALVRLLERLDREGRWREALRLAQALSALLALLMRWVELVRSLQVAVDAAQRLGDWPAVAWARHELGTLRLAADDVSGAERELEGARKIRQRAGDRRGLAATDRNLQVLCRRLRQLVRDGRLAPRGRALRFPRFGTPLTILAATLLLAGGVGGAVLAVSDGAEGRAANASPENGSRARSEQPSGHTTPGQGPKSPGQGPTDPGSDPTNPDPDRTGPRSDPTDPEPDPIDPRSDPTDPGPGPTDPGPGPTDPEPGPTDPEPGPTDPEPGPTDPEPGPTDPEPGPTDPEPGPTDPEPGPTDPEPGPTDPEPGPTDPEPGPTNPEPHPTNPRPRPTNPRPRPTNPEPGTMNPGQNPETCIPRCE